MTDQEKILSNDYYDVISDFSYPVDAPGRPQDFVYQPVSGEIGVSYVNRTELPVMNISNFTYPNIPKLYGLMQTETFDPSSLIRSGITQVQGGALNLTGRGVIIGFLDTGECVILLQAARIYSNPIRKASGWWSAVGAYCKFNRCTVYIIRLARGQ